MAVGGATALKSKRSIVSGGVERCRRYEIARQSAATATAPAAGPNTTALVRVKTSEMVKLTVTVGILRTADPLSRVRPRRSHQFGPGGCITSWRNASTRTTDPN